MRIYNNMNMMTFAAKKPQLKKPELLLKPKFTKEDFYGQIDDYMRSNNSQEEYLNKFQKGVQKIIKQKSSAEYDQVEKNYISSLMSTIEMSDDISKIPQNYLRGKMESLINYRNSVSGK